MYRTRHGMAWHGMAWHGMAGPSVTVYQQLRAEIGAFDRNFISFFLSFYDNYHTGIFSADFGHS